MAAITARKEVAAPPMIPVNTARASDPTLLHFHCRKKNRDIRTAAQVLNTEIKR